MIKYLLLISIVYVFGFSKENVAFLSNQKYACINQGYFDGEKLIELMDFEQSKDYPIRFYIDDNNELNTDTKDKLQYLDNNTYVNEKYMMTLSVANKGRYMYLTLFNPKVTYLYFCVETNNWTIVK